MNAWQAHWQQVLLTSRQVPWAALLTDQQRLLYLTSASFRLSVDTFFTTYLPAVLDGLALVAEERDAETKRAAQGAGDDAAVEAR